MDFPNPYPERDGCQINVVTWINPRVTFGSYPQKGRNSLLMGVCSCFNRIFMQQRGKDDNLIDLFQIGRQCLIFPMNEDKGEISGNDEAIDIACIPQSKK